MGTFKRKITTVEAIEYTGEIEPAKKFIGIDDAEYDNTSRKLWIPQHQRRFEDCPTVQKGNYIVKSLDGRFYPQDKEEFESEYEPA